MTEQGSISRNSNSSEGKGKWGCLIALAAVQGVFLFFLVLIGLSAFMVKTSLKHRPSSMGIDENPFMEEIWSSGSGKTKAVVIPVRGFIGFDSNDGLFSSGSSSTAILLNSISRATTDDDVDAIILDVDSGGGGITASDIIYRALTQFKSSRSDRVIVVLMRDVAASGAYYVSLPADQIIAHPTTITGSIGVLMQTMNLKGLEEKIGIKGVTIKSGKNKDLLNPFEEVSDDHRAILQGIVDELQDRFVELVAENRDLTTDYVEVLADGKIYTANRAKELGLIDSIGYWDDAVDSVKSLLGVDELKIYRYQREFSISSLFRGSSSVGELSGLLPERSRSGFFYLWEPGHMITP